MRAALRQLRASCRGSGGAVLVETVLVFPIFLFVTVGFFEMWSFYWQMNMLNAGLAQVTRSIAMLPPGAPGFDAALTAFLAAGGVTPVSVTCGAGSAACSAAVTKRLLTGSDASCDSTGARMGLCDFVRTLTAENLRLTYVIGEYIGDAQPIARVQVQLDIVDYAIRLPVMGSTLGFQRVTVSVPPGLAIMDYMKAPL